MSVKILQEKIGAAADGAWGPGTLKAAQAFYKLSDARAAHFFAQCAHESGGFVTFNENLNYSDKGLNGTFKKYFPTIASTAGYARKPEKIANKVYGGRMGNGPEASGDGYKYRGRGAIQLTGKSNYEAFAKYQGILRLFQTQMLFLQSMRLKVLCTSLNQTSYGLFVTRV